MRRQFSKKKTIDGVTYASGLEYQCHKIFKKNFPNVRYEPETLLLLGSETIEFCHAKTKNKKPVYGFFKSTLRSSSYTPDFIIVHNNKKFVIEIKGWATEKWHERIKNIHRYFKSQPEYGKTLFFCLVKSDKEAEMLCEFINEQ